MFFLIVSFFYFLIIINIYPILVDFPGLWWR